MHGENSNQIRTADSITVVYFDGVCNLCNWCVDFLIATDNRKLLRYAPLQGTTAKKHLGEIESINVETALNPDSIVVVDGKKILLRSDAVLFALTKVGPFWAFLAKVSFVIPRCFRDSIYRFVARNRYRFFGRRDSCRIPSPEERELFLP